MDIDVIYAQAEKLSKERGHNPDLSDLDQIVEDAIDLALRKRITETDVFSALDLLISKDGMTCNSCKAMQDCTPDCQINS